MKNTKILPLKSEVTKTINSAKNHWFKYFYLNTSQNILFSIDQFVFEFSKKVPQKKKFSEFKLQLKERKKLKVFYGLSSMKQLIGFMNQTFQLPGSFSTNFLSLLERRLDVILYRSNFTKNINQARQLIVHRKVLVNNCAITIPSYQVKFGDILSIEPKTKVKIVENLRKNFSKSLEDSFQGKTVFSEKFIENLPEKRNILSQKSLTFLVKLLLKKIDKRAELEFFKIPYSSQYFSLLKNNSFSKNRKNADNISSFTKFKQSEKHFYKQIVLNILSTLHLKTLPHELLKLKLLKITKKTPIRKKFQHSMRFYGVKPLHLEISYKLMKIIFLYSPQRVYYPFYINIDILKRSVH